MEAKRQWFRSRIDGNLGFLVERNGRKYIQLNRNAEVIQKPYNENDWDPQASPHRFNVHQIGRVAWEADKAFCRLCLGLHNEARESWDKISPERRERWLREGPSDPEPSWEERRAFFQVTFGHLLRYAQ